MRKGGRKERKKTVVKGEKRRGRVMEKVKRNEQSKLERPT